MMSDQPPSSHPRAVAARARLAATGRRAVLPTLVCLCGWFALGAASRTGEAVYRWVQPSTLATTVPTNGDVNPYGIVTVPRSVGALQRGDVLVSNFNNSANQQGTGTTIVQIPPGDTDTNAGDASVFAQINPKALPGPCPGGVGLTTALAVTRSGFVIVGSLPTTDGTVGDRPSRMPARAQQPREGDRNDRRRSDQRSVGHDRGRSRLLHDAVRDQRAQRHGRGRHAGHRHNGQRRRPRHGRHAFSC